LIDNEKVLLVEDLGLEITELCVSEEFALIRAGYEIIKFDLELWEVEKHFTVQSNVQQIGFVKRRAVYVTATDSNVELIYLE
jgi:hypothetical protein